MAWLRYPVPQEDLDQERELAKLEGHNPETAVRAYISRERHFYDATVPLESWAEPLIALGPMPVFQYRRSPESIERRRIWSRDWWRRNGAEYRRSRAHAAKESAGPREVLIRRYTQTISP